MLKICHLVHDYFPSVGGIEIQTKNLSESLTLSGHNNIVVTKRSHKFQLLDENINGVEVLRRLFSSNRSIFPYRLFCAIYNTFFLIKIRAKYQLIHLKASYIEFLIPCWLLRKIFGKYVIYSLPTSDEIKTLKTNLMPSFQLYFKKKIIHTFDAIITMSEEMKNDAVSFGIHKKKIYLVTNGIEVNRFLPIFENRIKGRVIYVGRINHQKGIDVLLKAWKIVIDKFTNFQLFIAGPLQKDSYVNYLKSYQKKNNLQNYIKFVGEINYYSNDIVKFYQSADIFVLPSRREGMPGSLLQAMACGLPVVSTKVSGAKELVKEGVNGKLIDIGDEKKLAEAILDVLTMSDKKKIKMGMLNRKIIENRFDQEERTQMFINIFKKVINN